MDKADQRERLKDLRDNLLRLKKEMIETEQLIASIQGMIKKIKKDHPNL